MMLVKQPIHTHLIEYHNMTSNLIRNISNKNYDAANEILSEHVSIIMEKKLFELKKNMAAKMCEQMGFMGPSRAEKLRTGVLEEDELDETIDPKEDSMSVERGTPKQQKNTTVVSKNNMGGPGSTHNKNMKEQAAGGSGLIVPKSNTREKRDLPSSVTIDKISPEKQSAIDIISKNTKALIDLKNKGKYKGPIDQAIEEETEEQLDEMQVGKSSGISNMAKDMRLSQEPKWNETNKNLRGFHNPEPRLPNADPDPHSFRSNTPVYSIAPNKQAIAKYVKPNLEEENGEQLDEVNVPTVNYQGSSGSSSVYTRSTKNPFNRGTEVLADKMKQNIGGNTQTFKQKTTINNLGNNSQSVKSSSSTSTMNEETEKQLDEARVKIIKARIRGGKIQRRKKVSNVEGYKVQGGQLKRMSPTERRHRKLGQKRGKIKRRSKMTRTLMKRQKSIRKRQSLGI